MVSSSLASNGSFYPAAPKRGADTGLSRSFLLNLILKTLYYRQEMLGHEIGRDLCLPFSVIDEHVSTLRRENLVEVSGAATTTSATYRFKISDQGRERARQALNVSHYVGPAPVTLEQYIEGILEQTSAKPHLDRDTLRNTLSSLVLPPEIIEQIGPALESQRALFLHGEPGNGKTALAEAIGQALGGDLLMPHAVEIDNHVIKVLDPIFHGESEAHPGAALDALTANVADPVFAGETAAGPARVYDEGVTTSAPTDKLDDRWVQVKRPVVFAGGELDLEMLDLTHNDREGYYEAPLHMKANGGVFIIDDFGRQLVKPRDLLNRWIVPLDKGIDFLTLHTGRKFPIPFHAMVIFATNLSPHELVDDAFLRRIHYKVEMVPPGPSDYKEIFWRQCAAYGIDPSNEAIEHIYRRYYKGMRIPIRACHPRDLILKVVEVARWNGEKPSLSIELIDLVCRSYFLADDSDLE